MTVRYTVFNGQVIARTENGARRFLVSDPQGNIIKEYDDTQTVVATRTYWPFGEVRTETGTPGKLGFGGALGYRTDTATRIYVRARELDPRLARWLTADPLWFMRPTAGPPYTYAGNNPTTLTDPSGLLQVVLGDLIKDAWSSRAIERFCADLDCMRTWQEAAERTLKSTFGQVGNTAGYWNAVGHCIAACLITRYCPPGSYEAWEAREGGLAGLWPPNWSDSINNQIGHQLAKSRTRQCADLCCGFDSFSLGGVVNRASDAERAMSGQNKAVADELNI